MGLFGMLFGKKETKNEDYYLSKMFKGTVDQGGKSFIADIPLKKLVDYIHKNGKILSSSAGIINGFLDIENHGRRKIKIVDGSLNVNMADNELMIQVFNDSNIEKYANDINYESLAKALLSLIPIASKNEAFAVSFQLIVYSNMLYKDRTNNKIKEESYTGEIQKYFQKVTVNGIQKDIYSEMGTGYDFKKLHSLFSNSFPTKDIEDADNQYAANLEIVKSIIQEWDLNNDSESVSTKENNKTISTEDNCAKDDYEIALSYDNKEDYENAILYYIRACNKGFPSACYNLAHMYNYGDGVEIDMQKSVELYIKASDLGNASAQNNLGVLYENGNSIEKNIQKALLLYEKASNNGDAGGHYNLGKMYHRGNGVKVDIAKALDLYKKACEAGNSAACHNYDMLKKANDFNTYGLMHIRGDGVEKDVEKAIYGWQKACEGEISDGCYNLAILYEKGVEVQRDTKKSVSYYRKACEYGDESACEHLLLMESESNKISYDQEEIIEFNDEYYAWVDKETGLMWEVKQNSQWGDELVWSEQAEPDGDFSTFDYVDELNSNNYAGFNDWRVPLIEELASLAVEQNANTYLKRPLSENIPSAMFRDFWWSATKDNKGEYIMYYHTKKKRISADKINSNSKFELRCVRNISL